MLKKIPHTGYNYLSTNADIKIYTILNRLHNLSAKKKFRGGLGATFYPVLNSHSRSFLIEDDPKKSLREGLKKNVESVTFSALGGEGEGGGHYGPL